VARCRTAKQFDQFQAEKHLYPNLEWLATRSADTRELHLSFVGTVLPIDDPFWQENQPGNLYNCKCDWQTTDKEVSVTPAKSVKPSPGLEGNPASTGQIFTDRHPYIAKAKTPIEAEKFVAKNYVKPFLKEFTKTIDQYKGIEVVSENLKTGKMTILRNSINNISQHSTHNRIKIEGMFLQESVKNWTYLGYSNVEKGKHLEAAYFFYYKIKVNNMVQYANVLVHKILNAEVPYAIINSVDFKRIKKGTPKDLSKYIKK
jgi:hypothetical protein